MAQVGLEWWSLRRRAAMVVIGFLLAASVVASAQETLEQDASSYSGNDKFQPDYFDRVLNFLWQPGRLGYEHVWPVSLTVIAFLMSFSFMIFLICHSHIFPSNKSRLQPELLRKLNSLIL